MQINKISSTISNCTKKLGDVILDNRPHAKKLSDGLRKANKLIEGHSYNPARPVYYTLMGGFVLLPRLAQAREPDEFREIFLRDTVTILTILFAMKGLKSGMCKFAQKKAGFSLVSEAKNLKDAKAGKRLLGYLNPEGGIKALSSADIAARYSNIKDKDQLVKMLKTVDNEGGSVAKLFSVEQNEGIVSKIRKKIPFLNKNKEQGTPLLDSAKKMLGDDFAGKDNKTLIKIIQDITPDNTKATEGLEEIIGNANNKGILNDKNNPLTYYAKNIAANFETLSLAITAGFLGFGLPKINEIMTTKRHLDKPSTNPDRAAKPTGGCEEGQIYSTIKLDKVNTFEKFV